MLHIRRKRFYKQTNNREMIFIYLPGGHSAQAHTGREVRYFWVRILPKVIFLGPSKTETMFMICFDTKHRYTDISWFDGGNPDFYLHCFGIFYVYVQISRYRMN